MIDSKILVSVVIVLVIGVAAAGYQISDQTPGLWQGTSTDSGTDQQSSSSTGTDSGNQQSSSASSVSSVATSSSSKASGSGSTNVKITSSEAKTIASKYILQDGATAGTPKLTTYGSTKAYLVPVMMNGNQVGEIYIDAQTGANLGGAGGAP
jgi:uncharacterized membrane protein YkoI